MAEPTPAAAPALIEDRSDVGTGPDGLVRFWVTQLKLAEDTDEDWVKRGRLIVERYRDERGQTQAREARYNILWSNVEILKPVLYGRTPNPEVRRRHVDNSEPAANLGAQILERALQWEDDIEEFDGVMQAVVEDRLLAGRGVARVFYEAEFAEDARPPRPEDEDEDELEQDEDDDDKEEDKEQDEEDEDETGAPVRPLSTTPSPLGPRFREGKTLGQANPMAGLGSLAAMTPAGGPAVAPQAQPGDVISERAPLRYVFWEDYRECPARTEKEIWWKAYRSYLTRAELVDRFGAKGDKVTLDYTPSGISEPKLGPANDAHKKAQVWEIWDAKEKETLWIATGYSEAPLDRQDDPLELPGFFPSPPALRATTTNEKRVPVADFIEYQDQAEELDSLTTRIDRLTRALKVAGVYAGEQKAVLSQLVDDGSENRLIPVEDWAAFADKGGLQGMIAWLPVEQIAKVLLQLYDARDRILAIIYQTTGLADIIRGETNPVETFGAQNLKSQFASRRISRAQKEVARFARDLMRLRGSVIARHFSEDTLELMSGVPEPLPPMPPPPPMLIPNPALLMGAGQPGGIGGTGGAAGMAAVPPGVAGAGGGPALPGVPGGGAGGGVGGMIPPPRPGIPGPPVPGARLARDGRHYLPDPRRPGKYLMVT